MICDRRDIRHILDRSPALLRPHEVRAVLTYRAQEGAGVWFVMSDGRMIDEHGEDARPLDREYPWHKGQNLTE